MTADRDQSIERLLRETRTAEPAVPEDCPDAETLAAMADDTLPAGLRREIEEHVAGCHRCQELTAAMARADVPVGARAAAGDVAAWKRRWLNWLVPAAAAATAVALWVLVPGQQAPAPTEPTADTQVAATPPALPPPTPEVIVTEPLRIPAEAREESAAASPAPAAAPASPSAPAPAAPPPQPPPAAAPPRPATLADAGVKTEAPATGGLQASAAERRDQVGQAAQPAQNETAALQKPAAAFLVRRAASVDVASPDPRVRWQIGPGTIVQRSTDGGATWVAQQTGASAELSAGSAPTVDVCWVAGRGGVIMRTTDGGRQWQRIALPETVDLIAITATTALNATVTLADGRRRATTDGGVSWMPAPQ